MNLRAFFRTTLAGRLLLASVLGFAVAIAIGEGAHLLLRDPADRAPRRVELFIPAGTAEHIAAGQPVAIPANLALVLGDTLVVNNQDRVAHQLGPVWVPAGASTSLTLELENRFAYECSFQPTRYLGLDVRAPTTLQTRATGILMVAPPMVILIALYSLLVVPLQPQVQR